MYSIDSLKRLNDEAVQEYYDNLEPKQCSHCTGSGSARDPVSDLIVDCPICDSTGEVLREDCPECDYCSEPAVVVIPVYNPADAVREPPITGAYGMVCLCKEHQDQGLEYEENFHCAECGELFIMNHSWDSLVVSLDSELYCHKCAAEHLEPEPVADILSRLRAGDTDGWVRINAIAGYREIWSGEFAEYSDFPGHQTWDQVADSIAEACKELGVVNAIPAVTQTYQFSCVLGVFAIEEWEEEEEQEEVPVS